MSEARWSIRPVRRLQGADAQAWDRLNLTSALPHAMLDSRFVDAMLAAFGEGREWLCTLGQGDALRAMCILKPLSALRWTTLLPSQAQVGPVQVGGVEDLRALIRQLPGRVQSLELLCIDPAISPTLLGGSERHLESMRHALTIRVRLAGAFDAYWQARPKKLRDNLRRYERRLAESGFAVRHDHVTDPAAMADAVRRYARLEASGWKGQRGTALDAGNQEAFYIDVMSRFAAEGKAVIYEMWIADMLAASRMMVVCGQSMVALKTTYDEAMAMFAPGRQQMKAMIEHQFALGQLSAIEFCTDASQDQLAWVDEHRHIEHVVLYRGAAAASLVNLGRSLRGVWRSAWIARDDPALSVDVYRSAHDLPKDVAHLFGEAERRCVQFGAAWLHNIEASVFAGHPGLRYFVLRHDNQPIAALPLVLEGPGVARRGAALANYYTALFAPAMQPWVRPTQLVALLRAVRREAGWLGSLHLAPMDPASFEYKNLLAALRMDGMASFRFFCFGNWYLQPPPSWQDYLAGRDGKLRSTVRRMTAKLAADGGRVEIITEPSELARGLAAYEAVYSLSWKRAEPYPRFIPGLLETCMHRGWLRLGLVWVGERPIAAQIWIVANGRADIYKLAYDEEFKRLSPGTVLTAALMQRSIDVDRVAEVDYLIGDDAYKKDWMNHRRERWGLIAYNIRTPSGLWGILRESVGRLATFIVGRLRRAPAVAADPKSPVRPEPRMTWTRQDALQALGTPAVADQWDQLNGLRSNLPFLSAAASHNALAVFGTGKEQLFTCTRQGVVQAMFVMTPVPPLRWRTFQPSQLPLGMWVALNDISLSDLVRDMLRGPLKLSLVASITQIDPLFAPREPDTPWLRHSDYIETGWIDITGDFDGYWAARGKNLRQNMRKQRNRLAAEGVTCRMRVLNDPSDMAAALVRYGELESSGWKADEGTAIHADNLQGRFYRELLEHGARVSEAVVYEYLFDDRTVAMNLCLLRAGVLVVLKTSYDETQKAFSPAFLLREEELQAIFAEQRITRIEYYGRLMDWHTKLTENKRMLYHLTVYRYPVVKRWVNRQRAASSPVPVQAVAPASSPPPAPEPVTRQ